MFSESEETPLQIKGKIMRTFLEDKNPVVGITDAQIERYEKKGHMFPTTYPITKDDKAMMKSIRKKLLRSRSAKRAKRRRKGEPEESQEEALQRECAAYRIENSRLNAMIKVLIVQAFCTSTDAEMLGSRMRTNFVFNEMTPKPIVFNAEMVSLEQDILPCGIQRTRRVLENIARRHEELCNIDMPKKNFMDDQTKVKRYNSEYIMLPDLLSYEEGRRACESLGSSLADIRNDEERRNFVQLMNSESRTKSYAGIIVSDKEASPIYMADGASVDMVDTKNQLYSLQDQPFLWEDFLNKYWSKRAAIGKNDYHDRSNEVTFRYKVISKDDQIKFSKPTSVILTPMRDVNIYKNTHYTVMCNRPAKTSTTSNILGNFKAQCRNNQVRLQVMNTNVNSMLKTALPGEQGGLETYRVTNRQFYEHFLARNGYLKKKSFVAKCNEVQEFEHGYEMFKVAIPELMDPYNVTRRKRSLAVATTTLAPFFSVLNLAIQELSKPLIKLGIARLKAHVNKMANSDDNLDQTPNRGQRNVSRPIEMIMPDRLLQEEITLNRNFTELLVKEQRLMFDFLHIATFAEIACKYLNRILEANIRLPLTKIWDKKTHRIIRKEIERNGIKLDEDMELATFEMMKTPQAYKINYQLPVQGQKMKGNIYKVDTLPLFYGEKMYDTKPYSDYIAVDEWQTYFMPMTDNEVRNCLETTCVIASPTISNTNKNYCGLDAFFWKETDIYNSPTCMYQIKEYKEPYKVLTIGDTSYFSCQKNTTVDIKCRIDSENHGRYLLQREDRQIAGLGHMNMPNGCEARIDNRIVIQKGKRSKKLIQEDTIKNLDIKQLIGPMEDILQGLIENVDNKKEYLSDLKTQTRVSMMISMFWIVVGSIVTIGIVIIRVKKKLKSNELQKQEEISQFNGEFKRMERVSMTSVMVEETQETAKADLKQQQQGSIVPPMAQERLRTGNLTTTKIK